MAVVKRVACLQTLAKDWEECFRLRTQVAQGKSLMLSTSVGSTSCLGNLKDCAENYEPLKATLGKMLISRTLDTPPIDNISVACREFLAMAHYPDSDGVPAIAHRDAWSLKRCLSTLRRKWSRQEVPKDFNYKTYLN